MSGHPTGIFAFLCGCALLFTLELGAGMGESDAPDSRVEPTLAQVLEPLSKNIGSFVETLQDTTCLERVEQRVLRANGKVKRTQVTVYEYLFTVTPTKYGISVYEMRREKHLRRGENRDTGLMITNGFPAAVLIFHANYSPDFNYELVGREKVAGRDTLVIGFRQNTGRKNFLFSFRNREQSWPVYVHGKAWVDATSFQVLVLETEMIEPNRSAGLQAENTRIEYEEVMFKHRKKLFWVPKRVQVQLAWRGKLFQNIHTFSNYMSFEVDTKQTIRPPEDSE